VAQKSQEHTADATAYRLKGCSKRRTCACRARHDSAIVDMFHGQHVTTRECPACSHRSRRFEAFMYITAPIVGSHLTTRAFGVVFTGGHRRHTRTAVRVQTSCAVSTFLEEAAGVAGVGKGGAAARLALAVCATPSAAMKIDVLEDAKALVPTFSQCGPAPCSARGLVAGPQSAHFGDLAVEAQIPRGGGGGGADRQAATCQIPGSKSSQRTLLQPEPVHIAPCSLI
jgi:hypothetical protein